LIKTIKREMEIGLCKASGEDRSRLLEEDRSSRDRSRFEGSSSRARKADASGDGTLAN